MAVTKTNSFDAGTAGSAVTTVWSGRANVAYGGRVTTSTGQASGEGDHRLKRVTDQSLAAYLTLYNTHPTKTRPAVSTDAGYVLVDMGDVYMVDTVKIWHFYADGRKYHGTKTEVSQDGINWQVVFDSAVSGEYNETSAGHTVSFTLRRARWIRDWAHGNTVNTGSHWVEVQAYGERTSGNGFDSVAGSVLYDATTLHGGLSAKASLAASTSSVATWNWGGGNTAYLRAYVRPTAGPYTFNANVIRGSAGQFTIGFGSAGTFRIADSAGAATTSTATYAANTWYRLEAKVTCSATVGQVELRIYAADATTPIEIVTTPATRNIPAPAAVQFGLNASAAATGNVYLDDVALTTQGWTGPTDLHSARANSFDGGAAGTSLMLSDTGGPSGDDFDTSTTTTGASLLYDPVAAHGGVGLKASLTAAATALTYWSWTYGPQLYLRSYVYTAAAPMPYQARFMRSGGTEFWVALDATGKFTVGDAAGAAASSVFSYAASTWYRVELAVTCSATAGQLVARIYAGDAKIPTEVVTSAANRNIPTPTQVAFGNTPASGTATGTVWLDDVAMTPVDWIGPAIPGGNVPGYLAVRLHNPDGSVAGLLPLAANQKTLCEHNGVGMLAFDYPRSGVNASLLSRDAGYLVLTEGGVTRTDYYLLDQDGDGPTDAGGAARFVSTQHPGYLQYLRRGLVYPATHAAGGSVAGLDPHYAFASATPGQIVKTLIDKAKLRGALPYLTYDFTNTADSAGTTWPAGYSITYDAGKTILSVVTDMADAGWCDVRMDGTVLRLYVKDTFYGIDRPAAVLRIGREVSSGPRQRNRDVVASTVLSIGDQGAAAEASNSTTATRYGERREAFDSRGGITDTGTVAALAAAVLTGLADAPEALTVQFDPLAAPSTPRRGVDYRLGDFIRYDQRRIDATTLEPLRVRSVAEEWTGVRKTISLELNDQFTELTARLARQIDGITNGSTSNQRVPQPPGTPDLIAPQAPASVTVTSALYQGPDGRYQAQATVSWPQVTLNADGTAYTDAGDYRVQFKVGSGNWSGETAINLPPMYISGLTPGATITVRVRTVDQTGKGSAYTTSAPTVLAADSSAPPVPSTPTATAMIGGVRLVWDGLGSVGETMPGDFDRAEVHRSTTSGFTPSAATLVDALRTGGVHVSAPLTYGTSYFFKLRSVDVNGNTSAASTEVSATPLQVLSGDVKNGTLGLKQIAFSQVGNLVDDGSFEDPDYRANRSAVLPAGWSFASDFANNGTYSLKITTNGTWTLQGALPLRAGARVVAAADYRFTATGAGTVVLQAVFRDGTGAALQTSTLATTTGASATWNARVSSGAATAPAGTVTFDVQVVASGVSTGTHWLDAAEIRQQVDTLLVADAAIVNAKIANLAVDDAKIGSVSATKITVGSLSADVTVSARIKTADTGARVELSTLGLVAYNSSGVNTITVASADGSITMQGEIRTAASGQRAVLFPASAGNLPEFRFYPTSGTNYAWINGPQDADATKSWIGMSTSGLTASANRWYSLMLQTTQALMYYRNATYGAEGGYVKCTDLVGEMGFITSAGQTTYFSVNGGTDVITWHGTVRSGTNDPRDGVFCVNVLNNGVTSSWAMTYGATYATTAVPVITHIRSPYTNGFDAQLVGFANTGITYQWQTGLSGIRLVGAVLRI